MMRLKELRKNEKITQNELAKKLNIPIATYIRYENGETMPNVETLINFANFYNVSLDYLVGREFGNGLGYLTETQVSFIKTFLALNQDNQMNAVVYVATMLANQ